MRGDKKKTPVSGGSRRKGRVVPKTVPTVGSATLLGMVPTSSTRQHRLFGRASGIQRIQKPCSARTIPAKTLVISIAGFTTVPRFTSSAISTPIQSEGFWSLITARNRQGSTIAVSPDYFYRAIWTSTATATTDRNREI